MCLACIAQAVKFTADSAAVAGDQSFLSDITTLLSKYTTGQSFADQLLDLCGGRSSCTDGTASLWEIFRSSMLESLTAGFDASWEGLKNHEVPLFEQHMLCMQCHVWMCRVVSFTAVVCFVF
jgi:hypothetical protein